MSLLGALFLLIGFVLIIKVFNLVEKVGDVMRIAKSALADIHDPDMHDDAKGIALRKYSIRLFALFITLMLGFVLAVFVPVGLIWILSLAGLISFDNVIATAFSYEFILVSTILLFAYLWLVHK